MHGLLLRKKGGGLEFSDDWRNANENDWPASCIEHWAQCPVSSNHQEKQKPAHVWYFDGEDNGEDGGEMVMVISRNMKSILNKFRTFSRSFK